MGHVDARVPIRGAAEQIDRRAKVSGWRRLTARKNLAEIECALGEDGRALTEIMLIARASDVLLRVAVNA